MPSQTSLISDGNVEHYFNDTFIQAVRDGVLKKIELIDNNNEGDLPPENTFHGTVTSETENTLKTTSSFPYERCDIERLKNDDWFIRRFLKWEPTTLSSAIEVVHQALVWRKRIQINSWNESTFPSEFYQIAACFQYLPDREGHPMIIVRLRIHKKEPNGFQALEQLAQHYFIYVLERIVTQNPNRGFGLIFDCHKASLSNVDLDMTRFIINTLSKYYSGAIAYVCIYELPWIFNQIWKLVRSWLDEDAKKIVKFATISNINEVIDLDKLPVYMGGSSNLDFRHVPKGAPPLDDFVETIVGGDKESSSRKKDIVKLIEHFQKLVRLSLNT